MTDEEWKSACVDFVENVYTPWYEANVGDDSGLKGPQTNSTGLGNPPPPPPKK